MDKYISCQECNGIGEIKKDSSEVCNICNGTGTDPRIINTKIGTIGISNFVRRQTKESRFSYFDMGFGGHLDSIAKILFDEFFEQCPEYFKDSK